MSFFHLNELWQLTQAFRKKKKKNHFEFRLNLSMLPLITRILFAIECWLGTHLKVALLALSFLVAHGLWFVVFVRIANAVAFAIIAMRFAIVVFIVAGGGGNRCYRTVY